MGALGPPALTLTEGPELAGADPGAIAGAGARFRAASGRVASLGSSVRTAQGDLAGGAWLGFGAIAFEMSAGDVIGTYRVAEQVLAGVSSALATLSSELAAAKAQAQAAERLAALVNTDTQTLNDAYGTRVRTQTATLAASLHHVMSVDDVAAVAAPTPAETAQADVLIGYAGRATSLMDAANLAARLAWQRAAAAFGFATAQSPAVRSAVAAASARAAAKEVKAHQGSFWGGLANLGGFLALGALDVGADVVTDGAATPLDEADAGEMASLGDGALADFAGDGASAAEVASAEEAALANVTVDGTKLGGQVAQDATSLDEGAASRVEQLQSLLDPISQTKRTSAVLNTEEGTDILASGGRDLSPAQRALAKEGDLLGKMPGAHAEVTALERAWEAGLTPSEMAVSRIICPECQAFVEKAGGTINPDGLGATWP